MANNLNLDVIAEGVETEEELTFLKSNGCMVVQGYLFSPPISGEEFERTFLERHHEPARTYDKRKGGQYFKLFALIVYTIDVFKNPHNIFLSVGDSLYRKEGSLLLAI